MSKRNTKNKGFSSPNSRSLPPKARCPKCGREVKSLCCGHCGSRLTVEQSKLYGAVRSKIAKMGGNHVDAPNKRGGQNDGAAAESHDELQNTLTPPSLCQWIYDRLTAAGVRPKTILDPCAGTGNLTRSFRPDTRVIEYEIKQGRNFFTAKKKIACDLVLCNPPWSEAERWLRHVVEIVGNRTPIVFISPLLFFSGYKTAPCRQYLESAEAPVLSSITPLPSDTFVRVYSPGVILWLNLPKVRNVALVPSCYLIRTNDKFSF